MKMVDNGANAGKIDPRELGWSVYKDFNFMGIWYKMLTMMVDVHFVLE